MQVPGGSWRCWGRWVGKEGDEESRESPEGDKMAMEAKGKESGGGSRARAGPRHPPTLGY